MERYFIFLLLCLIATLQAASAEKFHDCDNPPEVPNADFNIDENGDFVKAVYACKSGYELQGPLEIECDLDTDEWNTDPPICVQIEETEQPNTEQQQKKRGKIVENTKVSLELAASLDMSCATAQIEAPVVENGVLQSYERHSRDNFVFLAAIYACLDNYELEDPENNVLYCSQERWIGNTPECVGRNEDYEYTEEDEEETETEGETESESEDPNKMVENINVETGPDGKTTVVVNTQPATKETEEETPTEDDIYADENEDGNAIPGSTTQDPYDPQVLDDNCGEHKTDCSQICRRVQYADVNDIHYKCDCYEGFTLDPYDYRTCHDIDECELNNGNCSQICHNTPGSFNCGCEQGLQIDTNDLKSCIDINECERPEILEQCEGACENTLGSYKCLPILNVPEQAQPAELVCEAGFQPSADGLYCVDIDECASQTHECSYECINTNGAYQCVCPPNRHLLDDAHSCAVDTCEDLAKYNKPACSHACETLPNEGGYVCTCPDNYELSEDSHNCVAVQNPCDNGEKSCSPGQCLASDSFELGFTCQCPAGYALSADGYSCLDIDECLLGTHNCEQSCENTEGGYICSCRPGFTLDELQKCQDIDECAAGLHECADLQCVNEVGYYNCLCEDGKPPNPQTNQCDVVTPAADACAVNNCQHICLEDGNCACRTGYSLAEDGNSCFDINECLVNNGGCEQLCTNFNGGYECNCFIGFETLVTEQGRAFCFDIDECAVGTHSCESSALCENLNGSYTCLCPPGYARGWLGADHACRDIDECDLNNGNCSHFCLNFAGGFQCACPTGYTLSSLDNATCQPLINPCLEATNGGCAHSCSYSLEGVVSCACKPGYVLAADGKFCLDLNECLIENGGCTQACVNSEGSYSCACHEGYALSEDKRTCLDIDECRFAYGDCSDLCVNLAGSYTCACQSGFQLGEDAHTCLDIDECASGTHLCSHECVNTLGGYLCQCPEGYELDADKQRCLDLNECAAGLDLCSHECVNTEGGYVCSCPLGYELAENGQSCEQVLDACEVNNGGCSHSCSTTEGCLCPKGYILGEDQKTCVDVDECAEGNGGCAHICVNKQGGFECACEVGFEQDSLNAFNCVDIDECKNTTVCQYACVNTLGSYRCSCPKGYEADGNHCRDVNECLTDNGGCIGGICINHNGSHECRCPRGLQLAADLRTCRARTKPRDPCPVFKAPPHSVHKCETSRNKDNSYSVYCNVGCQPGYRLVGPARRVCNASGRWDPYENQCLPVVCPGLLAPLNGHIVPAKCTLNQVLMDTKCHLRCAQGYAPQGNSLAVCNSNGTWTQNSVLLCRPLNNNHFNPDLNRIPPPVVQTHNKQIPPPVFPVTNQAIVPTYATHAVGQIGKIPFCPTSINVTLLKHQARRSVYWKEPDFGPGSKIVFRSHFRGQLFSLGEHRVYYEAMDQHGSILRCVFNIIVKGPVPESRNTYPSMHLSMSNVIPGKVKPVVPSHKGLIQAKALPGHDTYIICPNKKPEKVNTAVFFFPSHCYFKNVRINARRHFNIQRSLFKSEWQPFFNF